MGQTNCKMLPNDDPITTPNKHQDNFERSQKAHLLRTEANTNDDEGERPLVTTERQGSPGSKHDKILIVRSKSMARQPLPTYPELEELGKKKTRTAAEIASTVERLLQHGRQTKHKIELKRKEKSRMEAKVNQDTDKKQSRSPRKKAEFLKSQEDFLARKNASLEKSRVMLENNIAEKCTYQPQININSRRMSNRKKPYETPMNQLSKVQASCLGESSPLKLRTITLSSNPKKLIKISKGQKPSRESSVISPSGQSRSHLANKLMKEFTAALSVLGKTGSCQLNYIEFCEVLKMIGMTSRIADCQSYSQAEERALLSDAFRMLADGQVVIGWTLLSFVMGVFGLDATEHFGKVCGECAEEEAMSLLNDSVKGSSKKTQIVTPTKQSLETPDKLSEMSPFTLNASLDLLNNSRLPLLGTKTRFFTRFSPTQINILQSHFKPLYVLKMSQSHSYSQILIPKRKQERTANSSESRQSRSKSHRDRVLSSNHKNRLLKEAEDLGIICPTMAPLDAADILHLEKLVTNRMSEIKRERQESLELKECSFKPKTISTVESTRQSGDSRFLYLYEMGKDKQRFKTDLPFQESLEGCTFQPNIHKTKSHRARSKGAIHQQTSQRANLKMSCTSERILQINVDLGHEQKLVAVNKGDDPRKLAREFLKQNALSPTLLDLLAKIIEEGMSKAQKLRV